MSTSYSTPNQSNQRSTQQTFSSHYTPSGAASAATSQQKDQAATPDDIQPNSDTLDEQTKKELLESSARYRDTRVKTSVYFYFHSYYSNHFSDTRMLPQQRTTTSKTMASNVNFLWEFTLWGLRSHLQFKRRLSQLL